MHALRGMVDSWGALALAVTWQLAALVVVAWLCERLFRLRHARARHSLWWFVLVAPLLLAPGRIALERREAVVRVAAPEAVLRVVSVTAPGIEQPANAPVETGPVARESARPAASWWEGLSLTDALAAAWVLGCLSLALRLLVGHLRVRRMIAGNQPVAGEAALRTLQVLLAQAGVSGEVCLRASASVGAPVLYGLRRPTILLPEGWVESLSPEDLRALLAHEVAHIKRRDFLAHFVQRLVEIPLFFHPATWLASRRITLAREELADAWALRNGADAGSYARSLAAAADRAQTRLSVVSVGVAEGRSTLLRRVEAIMKGGTLNRLSRPLVVGLVAIVLLSAGAFAGVQLRGEPTKGAVDESIADLRTLEQEMRDLGLAMLMYLQDSGGIFPPTDDIGEIQRILGPYMETQAVFARELRYMMPPGISVSAIENPSETPFAIADDHPEEGVLVYANGQTGFREKVKDESFSRIVEFRVLDEDGAPARGAQIRMLGDGREAVLTADARGHCKGVIEGGWRTSEAHFHVWSPDGDAERIFTIYFSGERTEKKVVLGKGAPASNTVSFSGRVVDRRGRPVAGASLWVYGFDAPHGMGVAFLSREIGTTDAEGEFSAVIPRMPVGNTGWGGGWMDPWTCQVIAHKPGQGLGWAEVEGDSAIAGLRISLARADGLRGTVRDKDGALLPNVLVQVEETEVAGKSLLFESMAAFPPWMETRTDDEGRFVLDDLPADATVKLGVSTCGAGEGYRADQMGPDLGEINLAEQSGELDIQLVQQPTITGVLLTPEGEPAAGVRVKLWGEIKGEQRGVTGASAVTDADGRFVLQVWVGGTWDVWAIDRHYYAALAEDLSVDVAETVELPATKLERNGTLRGRVLDAETGLPIPGVTVRSQGRGPSEFGTFAPQVKTDEEGRFEIGAISGSTSLSTELPPGYTWNHEMRKEVRDGTVYFVVTEDEENPSTRSVEVKPGEVRAGMDLYLRPGARLRGRLLGPDGEAWGDRGRVYAEPEEGLVERQGFIRSPGGLLTREGDFSIEHLYPGMPAVVTMVDYERRLGGTARVVPVRGEVAEATVRIHPCAHITGRVLMPDGTPAQGANLSIAHRLVRESIDERGRFDVPLGVVGFPSRISARLGKLFPDSSNPIWPPKYSGESRLFEVRPGQVVIDVGDIVLEPYEYPETD